MQDIFPGRERNHISLEHLKTPRLQRKATYGNINIRYPCDQAASKRNIHSSRAQHEVVQEQTKALHLCGFEINGGTAHVRPDSVDAGMSCESGSLEGESKPLARIAVYSIKELQVCVWVV
jgi:hypothetical protein